MSARSVWRGRAALLEHLRTSHLGAVKTTADLNLDTLGAHAHCRCDCHLHRATVSHLVFDLASDVGRYDLSVEFRTLDLVDVDLNLLVGELLELLLKSVDILAALADDKARTRGGDRYGCHLERALDDDSRHACLRKTSAEILTDFRVFEKSLTVFLSAIPVGVPAADHAEAVADWINFLSHLAD